MAYVPIVTSKTTVRDDVFRNVLRLVNEFALANTTVIVQDTEVNATYPSYTVFIPVIPKVSRNMRNNNYKYTAKCQVDFDVLPNAGGWRKAAQMADALDAGIENESANLKLARLSYIDSIELSNEPIDLNGQQVLSKSVEFTFEVLL